MSFWSKVAKWGITAAGGAGGFLIGGPAGAAAGASLGYGIGSGVDNAIDGSTDAPPAVGTASPARRPRKELPPPPTPPPPFREATNAWEAASGMGKGRAEWEAKQKQYEQDKAAWDKLKYDIEHPYEVAAPNEAAGAYGPTGRAEYALNQSHDIEEMREAAGKRLSYQFNLNDVYRDDAQSQQARLQQEKARQQGQLAREQGQEARGLQLGAYNHYADVLGGKAPSLAQLQLQQGLSDTQMAAQNMAVSARGGGGNQLLAMREAQRQNAMASQRVNAESAMLRAREMDTARSGLLGAASQIRGQDFNLRDQDFQLRAQDQALRGQDLQSKAQGFAMQQGMADSMYRNRQINDQQTLGLLGAQAQVDQAATSARQNYEQMAQHGRLATMQANQGMDMAEMGANSSMAQAQMQAQNQANLAYYAQQQENARANERMVGTVLSAGASMYGK